MYLCQQKNHLTYQNRRVFIHKINDSDHSLSSFRIQVRERTYLVCFYILIGLSKVYLEHWRKRKKNIFQVFLHISKSQYFLWETSRNKLKSILLPRIVQSHDYLLAAVIYFETTFIHWLYFEERAKFLKWLS